MQVLYSAPKDTRPGMQTAEKRCCCVTHQLCTCADAPPKPGAVPGGVHTLEAVHAGAGVPPWRQVGLRSAGCSTSTSILCVAHVGKVASVHPCSLLLPTIEAAFSLPRSLADLLRTPELHPSLRRAIVMALDAAKAMTYLHAHMCGLSTHLPCRRQLASAADSAAVTHTGLNSADAKVLHAAHWCGFVSRAGGRWCCTGT